MVITKRIEAAIATARAACAQNPYDQAGDFVTSMIDQVERYYMANEEKRTSLRHAIGLTIRDLRECCSNEPTDKLNQPALEFAKLIEEHIR